MNSLLEYEYSEDSYQTYSKLLPRKVPSGVKSPIADQRTLSDPLTMTLLLEGRGSRLGSGSSFSFQPDFSWHGENDGVEPEGRVPRRRVGRSKGKTVGRSRYDPVKICPAALLKHLDQRPEHLVGLRLPGTCR